MIWGVELIEMFLLANPLFGMRMFIFREPIEPSWYCHPVDVVVVFYVYSMYPFAVKG